MRLNKRKACECKEAMTREFWRQHQALSQTIEALNLAIQGKSIKSEAGGQGSRGWRCL